MTARVDRARGRRLATVSALLLGMLAGCAAPGLKQIHTGSPDLPQQARVDAVPFFPQERYHCGPAALAMTLAWSGLPVTQNDLVPQVYTPGRKGTLQADILSAARRNARLAVPVSRLGDILREIAAGHPVLVFQNLGLQIFPQWHYAVATGYDLTTGDIVLHSGTDRNRSTSLGTFAHTWARGGHWAVVVLRPGELPATSGELAVVRAAAGLERAGHPGGALTAYQSVLRRWPESFGASMGSGNARYALRDFDGAATAFGRAVQLRPRSPAAWNNFAHALARLDRRSEAIAAAERAVALGGKESPTFRTTLVEVSRPAL